MGRCGFPSECSSIMVNMNRLSTEKRAQIIGCLVEGNSIRATVRMTGAAKNTITKLLVDLGEACAEYQDGVLVASPLQGRRGRRDLGFCYAKNKNVPEQFKGTPGYGDVWTFTAICADTKLVPSWLVGERTIDDAEVFLDRPCEPDGGPHPAHRPTATAIYEGSVGPAFGHRCRLGADPEELRDRHRSRAANTARRSAPGRSAASLKGDPDPDRISTSYVERQNLTMRMGMRRFTRLTNGFCRKLRTWRTPSPCTSCTTTSPVRTAAEGALSRGRPRWRRGWPITSGRWKRSRRCWIDRHLSRTPVAAKPLPVFLLTHDLQASSAAFLNEMRSASMRSWPIVWPW